MSHAILAPSSAPRWVPCPGSVMMELQAPPEEESEEARVGTAAHWAFQQLMHTRQVPTVAPNGVPVDDEMVDAITIYYDDANAVSCQIGRADLIYVEQRVNMPEIHDQNWGTPDLVMLSADLTKLYLWDFKYGHKPVDPDWNWQLADYTAGWVSLVPTITDVEWRIVQPRCYGHPSVKVWRPTMMHLREMFQQLSEAAHKALSPNPPLKPTVDGCENCRGRHACRALQHVSLAAIDKTYSAVPLNLSAEALGRELLALDAAAELMVARLDGLRQQAEAMIRRGERVPHWGMESNPGKLKWTVSDKEIISIASMLGKDVSKPPQAITPTQAKKILPESVVKAYSLPTKGSMKLTKSQGWKE